MRGDAAAVVLEVRDLTRAFGRLVAVDGVNLTLRRGEFVALVGPNGAGKTTLLKMLSALARPSRGTVVLEGRELRGGAVALRRQIGVIAHDTLLYLDLTARENLRFYARMFDVADGRERVDEVLSQVGLGARADDLVGTFSRGMQQRLAIGRALLHRPTVLFLDEPYTGLDQHAADMLEGQLKALDDGTSAILMATHDLYRGLGLSRRVLVMKRGRIVYDGPPPAGGAEAFKELYYRLVGQGEG